MSSPPTPPNVLQSVTLVPEGFQFAVCTVIEGSPKMQDLLHKGWEPVSCSGHFRENTNPITGEKTTGIQSVWHLRALVPVPPAPAGPRVRFSLDGEGPVGEDPGPGAKGLVH